MPEREKRTILQIIDKIMIIFCIIYITARMKQFNSSAFFIFLLLNCLCF